jgi:hypothetical protein
MGQLINRYGVTGYKGEAGEIFMYNELQREYKVSDYRTNMILQSQGIDFGISKSEWRREYTLDVKNNLYIENSYYAFKIEIESAGKAGWFFTSKADRIYHTNAYMKRYLYYDLNELRYFVTKKLVSQDYQQYFKIVNHNSDVLIQFQLNLNETHQLPISCLF